MGRIYAPTGCGSSSGSLGDRKMKHNSPKDVDEYIQRSPREIQKVLQKMRETISIAAPGAKEVISYQMPAFRQGGILVYFAGFSDHISFFPTSSGVKKFKKDLVKYKTSKGTIQFPLGKPIPFGLISRITKFRVREELEKGKRK
jgi:uncharacterized protein YdhG (YjbR/CyaY superfamily)